jgi:hypothetical protein
LKAQLLRKRAAALAKNDAHDCFADTIRRIPLSLDIRLRGACDARLFQRVCHPQG